MGLPCALMFFVDALSGFLSSQAFVARGVTVTIVFCALLAGAYVCVAQCVHARGATR